MNILITALALVLAAAAANANPVDTLGDGRGASCERGNASFCRDQKPVPSVPGPLPIAGAAAAFITARRIRSRIR